MSFRILILALMMLIPAVPTWAQESAPLEPWERILEDEPELVERVRALEEALQVGDLDAIARQFKPGKLRLQFLRSRRAAGLHAHSQARALLEGYLRHQAGLDLRASIARKAPAPGSVHVALDALRGQGSAGRARRDRFVAVYRMIGETWLLTELRCP